METSDELVPEGSILKTKKGFEIADWFVIENSKAGSKIMCLRSQMSMWDVGSIHTGEGRICISTISDRWDILSSKLVRLLWS